MVVMPSVVGLFVLQFDGCCGCTFDVIFCDDSFIWSQQVPPLSYLMSCRPICHIPHSSYRHDENIVPMFVTQQNSRTLVFIDICSRKTL